MREAKQPVVQPMSVAEYIQYELTAERRHEYIDGQLFEMPGEKRTNNQIAGNIYVFFRAVLKAEGYALFSHDMKVSNHNRTSYYYPDVFATKELQTEANEYIQYEPELIVEVVSSGSRITDTVDKYIAYSAIPSMKYYLVVEPDVTYVTLYARTGAGVWEATLFSSLTDVIPLPLLETSLLLSEVYQ